MIVLCGVGFGFGFENLLGYLPTRALSGDVTYQKVAAIPIKNHAHHSISAHPHQGIFGLRLSLNMTIRLASAAYREVNKRGPGLTSWKQPDALGIVRLPYLPIRAAAIMAHGRVRSQRQPW